MADEKNGRARAGAVNADDEIAVALIGAEDLHVAIGKIGAAEPAGHGFGGFGGAADGFGGVDFDELLEDAAGEFAGFVVESGIAGAGDGGGCGEGESEDGDGDFDIEGDGAQFHSAFLRLDFVSVRD